MPPVGQGRKPDPWARTPRELELRPQADHLHMQLSKRRKKGLTGDAWKTSEEPARLRVPAKTHADGSALEEISGASGFDWSSSEYAALASMYRRCAIRVSAMRS